MANVVDQLVVKIKYDVDKPSQQAAVASSEDVAEAQAEVAEQTTEATAALKGSSAALSDVASKGHTASLALQAVSTGAFALASGVVGAIGSLSALGIAQAAEQDGLTKTARALRLTTEEYTALLFAADRSGVSASALGVGLRTLQQQALAAANGSADAVRMFEMIGVSATNANGTLRTAADLFPELLDGLAAMPDEGAASALAVRLLGEAGTTMASMIAGGSVEVEKLTRRAHELGIVLDGDAGLASEALTDAVTDLRGSLAGVGRTIGNEVIPRLTPLVLQMTDLITRSDGFVRAGLDRAVDAVGVAFDALQHPAGQATFAVAGLVAVSGGAQSAASIVSASGAAGTALTALGTKAAVVAWPLTLAALAAGAVVLAVDDVVTAMRGGDSVIGRFAESLGVGAEAGRIMVATGALITDGLAIMAIQFREGITLGAEFGEAVASGAAAALEALALIFPPLQGLATLLRQTAAAFGDLGSLAKAGLGGLATGLEAAAGMTGRVAGGSATRQDLQGFGVFGGTLLGSAQQRDQTGAGFGAADAAGFGGSFAAPAVAGATNAASVNVSPVINVTTGVDPREVADRVAQAGWDASYSALSAIGIG